MLHTNHAQEITNRFREMVEENDDRLKDSHYDELTLLIEAGLDAALFDYMEATAKRLEKMALEMRHSAEFWEE